MLWPARFDAPHSATYLALASAWQDVNQTLFTYVLRERGQILGLAQGAARPGRDAWDVLRLALVPDDPEDRDRAADAVLEQLLAATAARGGLRTFARAPAGGDGQALLARHGFRSYTTEYTLLSEGLAVAPAPLPEHLEFRARRPADAWGIFQLYCSVAPPQVRHAEGLSSKRWKRGATLLYALRGHWLPVREVVLADEGLIVGWVRLTPHRRFAAQRLDIMLHPRVYSALPALLAHATIALEARLDQHTLCYVRAYEDAVYAGLCQVGFGVIAEHSLLVKHAAARVTERQLLIAALRAQGLGIDASHFQRADTSRPTLVHLTPSESSVHDRTRAN